MIDRNQIPNHWQSKKLGEVCFTTSGGTPSRKVSKYYEGNIPWVKSGELDKGLITDTEEKITQEAIDNSSAKIFPKGTLLIALYGATIGKLAFLGVDAATNQAVCGIYKNENIDSDYLYYFLFFKKQSLVKQSFGGAQPNISQGILKDLEIPLPPLSEQQSIVAKIEELLSDLENGKQQLQTAQQQLKIYRQGILKWAFEGKLTNKNLNGELPKDWNKVLLESISKAFGGYAFKSPAFKASGSHQVLRIGNVRPGIVRTLESPVFIDATEQEIKKAKLEINDVIITLTGTKNKRDYGFTTLIKDNHFLLNQRLAAIRFENKITAKYFLYFSWTNFFKNQFFESETGNVGQGNVGMKAVTKALIPICSIEEQTKIIHEIESRFSVCEKIEEAITNCLLQSEMLRQSILKKAFEGKLLERKIKSINEKVIA